MFLCSDFGFAVSALRFWSFCAPLLGIYAVLMFHFLGGNFELKKIENFPEFLVQIGTGFCLIDESRRGCSALSTVIANSLRLIWKWSLNWIHSAHTLKGIAQQC